MNSEEGNMSVENKIYKLFVGNVPYKCLIDEFTHLFNNENGFVRAELIYKPKTEFTRGFGFVEVDSQENADKIINKQLEINNRPLRVSYYSSSLNNNKNRFNNYKLFVKNLKNTTNEDLHNTFSNFGHVVSAFVINDMNNEPRDFGVVEFDNKESFNSVLTNRNIKINDTNVTVYPYRHKTEKNNNVINKRSNIVDTKSIYRNGFDNGHSTGYNEGYNAGYLSGYDDRDNDRQKDPKKNYLKMVTKNVYNVAN